MSGKQTEGSHLYVTLSEEQMDQIAEKAADRALQKVYSEVGKGVLRKAALIIGSAVVALLLWFGKNHIDLK